MSLFFMLQIGGNNPKMTLKSKNIKKVGIKICIYENFLVILRSIFV